MYFRVREDKVDKTGKVSLRYDSRLYKIGIGRAHKPISCHHEGAGVGV
jgi:hypothetical protein